MQLFSGDLIIRSTSCSGTYPSSSLYHPFSLYIITAWNLHHPQRCIDRMEQLLLIRKLNHAPKEKSTEKKQINCSARCLISPLAVDSECLVKSSDPSGERSVGFKVFTKFCPFDGGCGWWGAQRRTIFRKLIQSQVVCFYPFTPYNYLFPNKWLIIFRIIKWTCSTTTIRLICHELFLCLASERHYKLMSVKINLKSLGSISAVIQFNFMTIIFNILRFCVLEMSFPVCKTFWYKITALNVS